MVISRIFPTLYDCCVCLNYFGKDIQRVLLGMIGVYCLFGQLALIISSGMELTLRGIYRVTLTHP